MNRRAIIITAVVAGVGVLIGATIAAAQAGAETRAAPAALPPVHPPGTPEHTTTSTATKPPKATAPKAPAMAIVKPPAQLPPSPVILAAGHWLAGVIASAGKIVKSNPMTFAGTAVDPAAQRGSIASAWDRFTGWFTGPAPKTTRPDDSVGVDTLRSAGGKK